MKTVPDGARLRLFLALIAFIVILPVNLSSQEPIDSKLLSGMQWRSIGPFRGGRVTAVAGAAGPEHVLFRHARWWSLENYRRRTSLAPDFRQRTGRVHRSTCGSSVRFECSVCRNRGTDAGQRCLSLDRRRRYLEERGAARCALYPGDRRRSQKSRRRRGRRKFDRLRNTLAAHAGNGKNRKSRNL